MPSLNLPPHFLLFLGSALLWYRLRGPAAFGMAVGFFLVLSASILLELGLNPLVSNGQEVRVLFIIRYMGSVISAVSFLIFAYGAKKYVVRDT